MQSLGASGSLTTLENTDNDLLTWKLCIPVGLSKFTPKHRSCVHSAPSRGAGVFMPALSALAKNFTTYILVDHRGNKYIR